MRIKVSLPVVATAFYIISAFPVRSQPTQTQIDLRAGYCLGVTKVMYQTFGTITSNNEKVIQANQTVLYYYNRYRIYILMRLDQPDFDIVSETIAENQGITDWKSSVSAANLETLKCFKPESLPY